MEGESELSEPGDELLTLSAQLPLIVRVIASNGRSKENSWLISGPWTPAMQDAAIIPDHQVTDMPPVCKNARRLTRAFRQFTQQRTTAFNIFSHNVAGVPADKE